MVLLLLVAAFSLVLLLVFEPGEPNDPRIIWPGAETSMESTISSFRESRLPSPGVCSRASLASLYSRKIYSQGRCSMLRLDHDYGTSILGQEIGEGGYLLVCVSDLDRVGWKTDERWTHSDSNCSQAGSIISRQC